MVTLSNTSVSPKASTEAQSQHSTQITPAIDPTHLTTNALPVLPDAELHALRNPAEKADLTHGFKLPDPNRPAPQTSTGGSR